MYEEQKKFKSSAIVRVKWTLLWGIVGGCISSFFFPPVFSMIVDDPGGFLYYWMRHPLSWPMGIFTFLFVVFLSTCIASTKVVVSQKEVQIKQFFKTKTYKINEIEFRFSKKEKTVVVEFLKFLFLHCYMFVTSAGGEKQYHLFFFSEEEFTKLISEMRTSNIKNIPSEARVEIREQLLEDEDERGIEISAEVVRKREQKRLLKTLGVYLFFLAAVFLVSQFGYTELLAQLKFLIAGVALILAVFIFPMELFTYKRVAHTCPENITYSKMGVRVGKDYYSFSQIQKITMTSPVLTSKSILPVQRYMLIQHRDGSKKYWIGNAQIMEESMYRAACQLMEEAMLFTPHKVVWCGKQSILTR